MLVMIAFRFKARETASRMHEIPFASVNLSAVPNPVPAIMSAAEFSETWKFFKESPAMDRSLVSAAGQALIFSLIRNARPEHIVEVGSFKGGTTECIARALDANGRGLIHTIGPFDSDHFLPILKSWPGKLKSRVRFYPTDSMSFFMEMQRERIRPWLVFVDGCHDYEFALFDIQCSARSIAPGGFIVVDNMSQAGPYFAARDFLKGNPEWLNCEWKPGVFDQRKAFDLERRAIINTDFSVLRAPNVYALNDRPHTFGEVNWPTAKVEGIKLELADATVGTLHVQCVLRGFSNAENIERTSSASYVIDGKDGEIKVMFERPLALEGIWSACRVEPWLIWIGPKPLTLREPPQPL
jgi:predicted O-methyltransferase YrrM